jgi:hypothetical protein
MKGGGRHKNKGQATASQQTYNRKIEALRASYIARKEKLATSNLKAHQPSDGSTISRLIDLLPTRTHAELLAMYKNCVRRMVGRKSAKISPSVKRLHQAITEEWLRRTEMPAVDGEYFKWPTTEASSGNGRLSASAWRAVGMLSAIGYHVGRLQGVTENERHFLLDQLFSINLPPLNDRSYMREWASPSSSARLRKLAETIAALTRNAKRRSSQNMQDACDDWEIDLTYLHKKYYVGHFGFDWPSI